MLHQKHFFPNRIHWKEQIPITEAVTNEYLSLITSQSFKTKNRSLNFQVFQRPCSSLLVRLDFNDEFHLDYRKNVDLFWPFYGTKDYSS